MAGPIRIAVLVDAGRSAAELDRVGGSAVRMSQTFSRVKSAITTAFAGAAVAGVVALGAAVKAGVKDAIAYEAAQNQAAAALKASGNAAGQTLASLKERAASIETLTGATQDENDVIAAQSRLLRAGLTSRGAFNDATLATANLAAASGQNISAASKVMTKALQDPTKAAGALRRANVILSESQQKQIKDFVESGQTAKAQAIVLEAVNKQLGGAAAAQSKGYAATIALIKDTFQDFARDLGTRVLPFLQAFANQARASLPAVLAAVETAANRVGPVLATVFSGISASLPAVKAAASGLITVLSNPVFQSVAAGVLAIVGALKLYALYQTIVTTATTLWAAAQTALNVAMAANPVGIIVLALIGLAAAFVVAYKRSEEFRNFVNGALNAVKAIALAVWDAIRTAAEVAWRAIGPVVGAVIDFITAAIKAYLTYVKTVWEAVRTAAEIAWKAIGPIVRLVIDLITAYVKTYVDVVKAAWSVVSAAASVAWNLIKTVVSAVLLGIEVQIAVVRTVVTAVWTAISTAARAAWTLVSTVVSGVTSAISAYVNGVQAVAVGVWNTIKSVALAAFNAIPSGVRSAVGDVVSSISNMLGRIRGIFSGQSLFSAGARLIQTLADGVASKINAVIDKVRDGLNTIKGMLPGSPIKHGPLKHWNNGGAGKELMALLAAGVRAGVPTVNRALSGLDGSGLQTDVTTAFESTVRSTSGAAAGGTLTLDLSGGTSDDVAFARRVLTALQAYTDLNGPVRIQVA